MLRLIRADLEALGIRQDVFSSERKLVSDGKIDEAVRELDRRGFIYTGTLEPPKGKPVDDWEPVPLLLFKSTEFGDDVDRPLKKSNGGWTYFASDIAYHWDKFRRGARVMIDVWGADHGGHIRRVQAAVQALTGGDGALDVKICQMVRLLRDGRAGQDVEASREPSSHCARSWMKSEKGWSASSCSPARTMHRSTSTSRRWSSNRATTRSSTFNTPMRAAIR